jgi:hypothetical protein
VKRLPYAVGEATALRSGPQWAAVGRKETPTRYFVPRSETSHTIFQLKTKMSGYSQMMSMSPMSGSPPPPVPQPPTFPDKPADGADQATINSYVDGTLDVLKHCVGMLGSAIFSPQPPTNWYGF